MEGVELKSTGPNHLKFSRFLSRLRTPETLHFSILLTGIHGHQPPVFHLSEIPEHVTLTSVGHDTQRDDARRDDAWGLDASPT